jgi:hypothetical protein
MRVAGRTSVLRAIAQLLRQIDMPTLVVGYPRSLEQVNDALTLGPSLIF